MTGQARDDNTPLTFLDFMVGESRAKAAAMWDSLLKDTKPLQEELQLNNPKVVPLDLEGKPIEFWVLASSQPEIGPDGQVRYVTQKRESRCIIPSSKDP